MVKMPQSDICSAPCAFQKFASPLCFYGCPHCCFPSKIVFHKRVSSIKGRLSSKVVFHQRLSSIKGRLPSKVVFHQRSSSIKGCIPSKVVFHQRPSSIAEMEYRASTATMLAEEFWQIAEGSVEVPANL